MAKHRFKKADWFGDPSDPALREALAKPAPEQRPTIQAPPKVPEGVRWRIKPLPPYGG